MLIWRLAALETIFSVLLIDLEITKEVMIFKNTEFNNVYPEPCNQKQKQPPKVFCKKRCFRNFAKFTGKHLCQSLFFNKVASLRLATVLKKRPWRRCFPMNFEKFLRTPILKNTSWLLLLQKELLRKKPNVELFFHK